MSVVAETSLLVPLILPPAKQAASKALTLLIKQDPSFKFNDKIKFSIKETTRNSRQKTYT